MYAQGKVEGIEMYIDKSVTGDIRISAWEGVPSVDTKMRYGAQGSVLYPKQGFQLRWISVYNGRKFVFRYHQRKRERENGKKKRENQNKKKQKNKNKKKRLSGICFRCKRKRHMQRLQSNYVADRILSFQLVGVAPWIIHGWQHGLVFGLKSLSINPYIGGCSIFRNMFSQIFS